MKKIQTEALGHVLDLLAPSEAAAEEFAANLLNAAPPAMLDAEHFSEGYVISHYGEGINNRCRADKCDDEDMGYISYVGQHRSKGAVVVYRGVTEWSYQRMKKAAKDYPGVDLYETGFMHCALVKGREYKRDYQLRILVPAGSAIVYLGNAGFDYPVEPQFEVVIQTGAKLRILSRDREYINCELLTM